MNPNGSKLYLSGFTLIELLVVTSILGVVIAAIAGSLLGGINVYDTARRFNQGEGEAALALETMQQDLANAFDFYDLSFVGHGDSLVFPSVVENPIEGKRVIGQVSYLVDEREKVLLRKTTSYPNGKEYTEALVKQAETLELSYYNMTQQEGGLVWQSVGGVVTGLPARVDVRLTFLTQNGAGEMTRTFLIPLKMSR